MTAVLGSEKRKIQKLLHFQALAASFNLVSLPREMKTGKVSGVVPQLVPEGRNTLGRLPSPADENMAACKPSAGRSLSAPGLKEDGRLSDTSLL